MRLTVEHALSEAAALSADRPAPGDALELDDPCAVNGFGLVHPVRGRPWLLTRVHLDELTDEGLRRLVHLHRVLHTAGAPDGVHSFFWYGVARAGGGPNERILLETDLARRTRSLREASMPDQPLALRLRLASSLAGTVAAVAALPATLGRLDGDTIRLDLAAGRAVVTGLESAAFGRSYQQLPLDAGAADGQLAPELYDGEGIHPDAAGAQTDAWALAVALHRLLFGRHPYAGAPDLRPDTMRRHGWPAERDAVHHALPADVVDLFRRAFERGGPDPAARPSAAQWSAALGPWTGPPEFAELRVDRLAVVAGEPVTVTWSTRNATHVRTAAGQRLAPSGTATFAPAATGSVRLWAVGPAESVSIETATILVLRRRPTPRVRPVDRPEPIVAEPQPRTARYAGRPPRPPAVGAPPAPPRFTGRPSKYFRGGS